MEQKHETKSSINDKHQLINNKKQSIENSGLSIIKISSKSSSLPPFKASGELLDESDDINYYYTLYQIHTEDKKWRQVLGSYWPNDPPIDYNGYKFATEAHALAGAHFMEDNPDHTKIFSLESKSLLSKPEKASCVMNLISKNVKIKNKAKSGSKSKTLESEIYSDDVEIDKSLTMESATENYNKNISKILEDILYCKYTRYGGDKYARQVLLATNYALLVNGRGNNLNKCIELMNVREIIRQEEEEEECKIMNVKNKIID